MNYQRENYYNVQFEPSVPPPPIYDLTVPPKRVTTWKTDDEIFVEAWSSRHTPTTTNQIKPTPIQINKIKQSLNNCLETIKQLESKRNSLEENIAVMSTEDWRKHTVDIGALRQELTSGMSQFQNSKHLSLVKSALEKRTKKRLKQKRGRASRKADKADAIKLRADMHKTIDDWLEGMKETVQRAKAEESLKRDADCVLAEVTKKKSDARKQLSLIAALVKLRGVRDVMARNRGERLLEEDEAAFEKAVVHLKEMWEGSLRTYGMEEQGLRVMLEKSVDEGCRAVVSKEKIAARGWQEVLFGGSCTPNTPLYWGLTSAERDLETFVAIRKSWDTFLSKDQTQGSGIPVGWVLPTANSDSSWAKYLKPNRSI